MVGLTRLAASQDCSAPAHHHHTEAAESRDPDPAHAAAQSSQPKPQAAAALESAAKRRRRASDSAPGRCVHGPLPAVGTSHRGRPGGGGSRAPEAHGDAGGADEGGGQGWRHLPRPLRGRAQHEIHHVSIPERTLGFSLLLGDRRYRLAAGSARRISTHGFSLDIGEFDKL